MQNIWIDTAVEEFSGIKVDEQNGKYQIDYSYNKHDIGDATNGAYQRIHN
jgi:hypothetical protein